jgi:hypothetical protein
MLKLLLDEHLSPRVTQQFRAKSPLAQIESILLWQGGRFAGMPHDLLLSEAHAQGWTLLTYDQSTIVPLLKGWGEQGIEHGGVILVDHRTIAANDIGGLIQALGALWNAEKNLDWKNAVIYVSRS